MPKRLQLTGKTFGNLLVLKELEPRTVGKNKYYDVQCKCLKCNSIIIVNRSNLTSGHSTQCKPCAIKDGFHRPKHGMRKTRLYRTWVSMRSRCKYPSATRYSLYGGRGITVCPEWNGKNGFENFAKWALSHGFVENAEPYSCTLDRIDTNKGYSPQNCRFVSNYDQSNNRNSNITITDTDGEVLTLKQAAKKHNLNYQTVHSRWARGSRDVSYLLSESNARTGERTSPFK